MMHAALLAALMASELPAEVRLGPVSVVQWLTPEGLKQEKIGANCPAPITTEKTLAEWAVGRWSNANEVFVVVLQSRPRPCAVPAYVEKTHGLLEGGLGGTVAAVRMSSSPVSVELIAALGPLHAYAGWPRPSTVARGDPVVAAAAEVPLSLGLFCWPAKNAWPKANRGKKTKGPFDAVAELDAANPCELWLVPKATDQVSYLVAGATRVVKESKVVLLNDVDLPAAWGKVQGAMAEVSLPVARLLELRRVRFPAAGISPPLTAATDAGVDVSDVGVVRDAAVVVPSPADAGVVLVEAEACTPSCLPPCTSDQLASPAMSDVRGRVEQHLAAQEISVEWPIGGVPVAKGVLTPRDCAAFELLMFTLSRHLSCQVPIARCAGAEK
jgi:hypothetical protein